MSFQKDYEAIIHLANEFNTLYFAIVDHCQLDKRKMNYTAGQLRAMLELQKINTENQIKWLSKPRKRKITKT
jgi:hypothetical protein